MGVRRRREHGKSFDRVAHCGRDCRPEIIIEIASGEPQHTPAHQGGGIQLPAVLDEARPSRVPPTGEGTPIDLYGQHTIGPGEVEAPLATDERGEAMLLNPSREAKAGRLFGERGLEAGALAARKDDRAQMRREGGGSESHAEKISLQPLDFDYNGDYTCWSGGDQADRETTRTQ